MTLLSGPGIYRIRHVDSGKAYIGSSNRIERRWGQHKCRLDRGDHDNSKLQRAWNKYGGHTFIWEVLRLVPETDLIEAEQSYLDLLGPWYNICPVAGQPPTHRSARHRASLLMSSPTRKAITDGIQVWPSIRAAARSFGVSDSRIRGALRNGRSVYGRHLVYI